jgi:hypothetical protein
MKPKTIKWNNSNRILPEEKELCLVLYREDKIEVRYYEPPKPNYCYGWYPDGCPTKNTFWVYLKDIPQPSRRK